MKRIELSILSWGIYLMTLGLALIVFPLMTVGLFGYSGTEDLWIRFTGILSVVLGMYYLQVAQKKIRQLYLWKVLGHVFGLICMIAFFSSGIADKRIIGTMVIETLACLWTLLLLKK